MKRTILILTLLFGAAFLTRRNKKEITTMTMMEHDKRYDQTKRGYHNNNPLNLRISPNKDIAWKGKIPLSQNTDRNKKTGKMEFEQFVSMPYGFRANMINMRTLINRGFNTIEQLITKWAPADDGNNPAGYTQRVCKTTGYNKDDIINPQNAEQMQNLAYAMAIVENGSEPQWDDIQAGWKLI